MKVLSLLFVVFLITAVGCDAPKSADSNDSSPAGKDESGTDGADKDGAGPNGPAEERVKAEVGVGKQGSKSRKNVEKGGVARMIAQPAASLFAVKERVVFEIQIPKTMQLYQATNGYFPKSHDEFMEHIITFGQIELPRLPAGQRYEYDAQSAQLMVVRPEGT